jgi:hypothetical protein
MKNFSKGQMAMLGAQGGLEPCEILYSATTRSKAQTILEFTPLLVDVDDVIAGKLPFQSVYREALYRKRVAERMERMKHEHELARKY